MSLISLAREAANKRDLELAEKNKADIQYDLDLQSRLANGRFYGLTLSCDDGKKSIEEQEAFWKVTVKNSRDPEDLALTEVLNTRIQDKMRN